MNRYNWRLSGQPLRDFLLVNNNRLTTRFIRNIRPVSTTSSSSSSRISRIESRLPRFLQRYVQPLRNAPISHITAFLILHELTAVVPLFGLTAFFHYTDWLPPYITEGAWVKQGVDKFGRYLRKKGWLGEEGDGSAIWWDRSEGGVRIVVELATAYAITKALLPFRLILSVWATPWFARATMLPAWSFVKKMFGKGTKIKPLNAAGTGATGGGVGPK